VILYRIAPSSLLPNVDIAGRLRLPDKGELSLMCRNKAAFYSKYPGGIAFQQPAKALDFRPFVRLGAHGAVPAVAP
jgi:hypothetical protein